MHLSQYSMIRLWTIIIGGAIVYPIIIAVGMRRAGLGLRDLPAVLRDLYHAVPKPKGMLPW